LKKVKYERIEHFGVKVVKKRSLNIVREEFAPINTKPSLPKFDGLVERNAYTDDTGTRYRREWCEEYREHCLKNFDLNMQYFNSLDKEEFNDTIINFLKKHSDFCEVTNLFDYAGVPGYYLMILDEYKQVYIGKSEDVKRRIMDHWSRIKEFDRTLFPMYADKTSGFSIDFFRALDTTRIYVSRSTLLYGIEADLVSDFPKKYLLNRIGGDISTGVEALATMNKRNL
jgi:hypothetical protein